MVKAAVGDVPGLEAGRLEIDRGGDSYTADTDRRAAHAAPRGRTVRDRGLGRQAELTTWERLEVIQRPGHPRGGQPARHPPPVGL